MLASLMIWIISNYAYYFIFLLLFLLFFFCIKLLCGRYLVVRALIFLLYWGFSNISFKIIISAITTKYWIVILNIGVSFRKLFLSGGILIWISKLDTNSVCTIKISKYTKVKLPASVVFTNHLDFFFYIPYQKYPWTSFN